jgi:hypothetical protein
MAKEWFSKWVNWDLSHVDEARYEHPHWHAHLFQADLFACIKIIASILLYPYPSGSNLYHYYWTAALMMQLNACQSYSLSAPESSCALFDEHHFSFSVNSSLNDYDVIRLLPKQVS